MILLKGARNLRIVIGLMCLTLMLPACQRERAHIRIGSTLWPGYDFLYLAQELGYFEEAGLNVKLFDFVSLSDSRRAFERGQIDVLAGTIVEMLIISNNSFKTPQTFYVTDFSNGADVILGRKPLESIRELKGKRVGVEPASLDLLTINLALKAHGMSVKDVSLVPMAQNGMEDNYDKLKVDALCTYPPTSVRIMNKGTANLLFNSSQIPGFILDVLIADESFINSHTAALAILIQCFDRAVQFTRDHPDKALPVIAGHESITMQELKDAYKGIFIEDLRQQEKYFNEHGQLIKATSAALEILREFAAIRKNIQVRRTINVGPVNHSLENSGNHD